MDVFALTMRLKAEGAALVKSSLADVRANLKTTEKGAQQLDKAMGGLASQAKALAGSLAAMAGGAAALRAVDVFAQVNNQLRLAAGSADGFAKAQADVIRIAQQTNQPLESVAELYGRVSRASAALGLSQAEVAKLTQTVSEALIVSGSDAGAAAGALTQLGQAMAAGTVRAEEFNSIMEGAPALIQGVEKSLGMLPGQLRKMALEGKLSSAAFSKAILNATTITDQFAKMVPTLSQQMVGLRNQFVLMTGRIAETTGATTAISDAIQTLKANLDKVGAVIGAATTAFVLYRGWLVSTAIASAVLTSAQSIAAFVSLAKTVRSVADAGALLNAAGGGWLKLGLLIAGVAASAAVYIGAQRALAKATEDATAQINQQADAVRYLGNVNASVHGVLAKPDPVTVQTVDRIALLVELADMVRLSTAEVLTLRGAESQLLTQLDAGNVSIEQRVKLNKQLLAVQAAVSTQLDMMMSKPPTVMGATATEGRAPIVPKAVTVDPAVIGQVRANMDAMGSEIDKAATKTIDNLNQGFAAQIGGTFANALGAGFEAALATGKISEGFRAFGKVMLSGLGGMLQAFGTQALIASGIMKKLMTSFATMNPVTGAAASVALIALGGALKGSASRIFGGGAAGGGGGGGSFTAASLPTTAPIFPTLRYAPGGAQPLGGVVGSPVLAPVPALPALTYSTSIAAPVLPAAPALPALTYISSVAAPVLPPAPALSSLTYSTAIAAPALPVLTYGASIAAPIIPAAPALSPLLYSTAIAAPTLPDMVPSMPTLTYSTSIAAPSALQAVPQLPTLTYGTMIAAPTVPVLLPELPTLTYSAVIAPPAPVPMLASNTYGPTTAATANRIPVRETTNVTIIGPNDPTAQRAIQELMQKANRRGAV